jgi:hypothetical protein
MVQSEKFPSATIDSVETPQFSDLTRWRLKVEHGAFIERGPFISSKRRTI